jgi:NAD(P)-dependent dehydrogenase (short-subunit alcohol dehydrogenase family)
MRDMADHSKVVLITGTSSGIGLACARHLAERGFRVFGTRRRPEGAPASFQELAMDVNDDASVLHAIEAIHQQAGRIDVLVNNAGLGYAGAIEDTSIHEARAQLETNFFGTLRLCQAVLPRMRAQGGGRIINISSIGGLIALPFQGMYCASKFAVEGMTEALRMEVRPFGIEVSLVEPGDFRTEFTRHRIRVKASGQGSSYAEQMQVSLGIMERDEQRGPSPVAVAKLIEKIIEAKNPRLRYSVGMFPQRLAISLRRLLPAWLFERIIASTYEVPAARSRMPR